MKAIDITGQKFSRLTAIKRVGTNNDGRPVWLFLCDCGNEHTVNSKDVRYGHSKSCGCYASDMLVKRNFKHGHTKHDNVSTPEFKAWLGMRKRVQDPTYHAYERYKARGIKICGRWSEFANFYEDMGKRPEDMTLERIDNNGNYEPSNCKWATRLEQTNNRENTIHITYKGETDTLSNWARKKDIGYMKLYKRIVRRGWDIDKALETP